MHTPESALENNAHKILWDFKKKKTNYQILENQTLC